MWNRVKRKKTESIKTATGQIWEHPKLLYKNSTLKSLVSLELNLLNVTSIANIQQEWISYHILITFFWRKCPMCIDKIPFPQVEELKLEIKPLRLFRLATHSPQPSKRFELFFNEKTNYYEDGSIQVVIKFFLQFTFTATHSTYHKV